MKQIFLILFSSIFIVQFDLSAQEVTGKIEGRIIDTNGLAIPNVQVSVSSPDLQGIRTTQTDANGSFNLILLPPGFYRVNINHISYRAFTIDSILVRLGRTTFAGELVLQEQSVELEEIVVRDRRIQIDPTSTLTGGNFTKNEIENLPLQRNYQDIPVLLPQINASYFGDNISYSGATGLDNRFFIDGIDVTDPIYNLSGTSLPYNFIREIEVKTGGYEAEYKSSLGGVVNVITQGGGEKFSGQAFGFYTGSRISNESRAVIEAETPKGDYAYYDFGLSLGGPLITENLRFNLSYNPNIINEDILIQGIGYRPDDKITHLFAGKLSWRISDKAQLVLNVLGDPSTNHEVSPGLYTYENPEPAQIYLEEGGYSASISGYYLFSDNFLLEAAFSRFFLRYIGQPETEIGNQICFLDYANNTISGGLGNTWDETAIRYNSGIKASVTLGYHKIKAGIEYTNNNFEEYDHANVVWKYADTSYFQGYMNGQGTVSNRIPSFFIQDSWNLNNSLQFNAGLRWEGQYLINSDGQVAQKILNQFQPRIGLIFLPQQNDNQKIFATYGRFYHDLDLKAVYTYYADNFFATEIAYDHDPRFDPVGGDTIYVIYGQSQKSITNLHGQFDDEFTLGYEQMFFSNHRLSVRGIYRSLGNGIDDAYSAELGNFILGNPGSYPLSEFPRLQRDYLAFEISFGKISDDPFNYYFSYVLSRSYGNYAGLFNPETQQYQPNFSQYSDISENVINSTGWLPYDRTHSFKSFGSYRFDFGLMIGAGFSWMSGTPLNEYGSTKDWPGWYSYIVQRGTAGRTPSLWDLNFRLAYTIPQINMVDYHARIIIDAFHIASRETPVNYDQVHYFNTDENGNQIDPNPNYGRAISFQPAMAFRFGLEVNF